MFIEEIIDRDDGFVYKVKADWGFLAAVPEKKRNRKRLLITLIIVGLMKKKFSTRFELTIIGIHDKESVLADNNALELLEKIYKAKSRTEAQNLLMDFW